MPVVFCDVIHVNSPTLFRIVYILSFAFISYALFPRSSISKYVSCIISIIKMLFSRNCFKQTIAQLSNSCFCLSTEIQIRLITEIMISLIGLWNRLITKLVPTTPTKENYLLPTHSMKMMLINSSVLILTT